MKWEWGGVEWGEYRPGQYSWYISWKPNWLRADMRYFGIGRYYYDGPHNSFGFWFFNISWSVPGSLPALEFMNEENRQKWEKRPRWVRWLMGL